MTATGHDDGDELVTVIMPARNEEQAIGDAVDSVLSQTYRNLQFVVIEGGSTDRTLAILEERQAEDARIEIITNALPSIPVSLNLGLASARGRWLVRVDAHSTVPPTYVEDLVTRLREGTWAGVGGVKPGVGVTPAGRAIAAAMGSRFGVGNSKYHYATSVMEVDHLPFGAYPVELLREVGGWNEHLVANEDYELDYRLRQRGGRLLLDPQIVIAWHCRQSVPDLYRQYVRYGKGKADVAMLHPASLAARHVVAPGLVAWVALAAVRGRRHPAQALVMISPYLAGVALATRQTRATLEDDADWIHLPGAFAAMHVGWGYGFWAGLLRGMLRPGTPLLPHQGG
ncbi:glycosyltransferase family 2 protein [Nocardioides cynanchi]|uniref:glycosyltransferase family 2 protein n=1 Tax=Nocardioides cynanchi TaxID=2558918 RepID=UPI0012444654|nr:glycosyltransferase family 2 protein [Nocardioides cynanchi]